MSVFREIKIQKGFGDNETGASGTAYIINMVRDLQGTFRTRYSYMSSASLGSGAIITDLASFGTGNFFAISNGVFYWSNNLGISWSACSGTASFTPTCGDWAVLGTKVIYCDRIAGRPIIFTMSSPPAFSEITTPAFLSNAAERCCVSQNTLLVCHGNNEVHFSAVADPSTFGSTDYFPVGGSHDPIVAMADLGESNLVLKTKSLFIRTRNDADFDGQDYRPILNGITVNNCSKKNYCLGNNQFFFLTSAGPYRISADGSIVNLLDLAPGFRDKWMQWGFSDGEKRLEYWNARDWFIIMNGNSSNFVFDNKLNLWYSFTDFGDVGCCHPSLRYFYTDKYGDDELKMWSSQTVLTGTEKSMTQMIVTQWEDGGNALATKQGVKVYIYGYGIDAVELHGRKNPSMELGESTKIQEWDWDNRKQVYNVVGNDIFNEYALKLTGSGEMIVKALGVEYNELQFAKRKE